MEPSAIIDYYVLFHNHTEGMALYQYIRSHGANARICPVPRSVSACCGMSLLVLEEDIAAVRRCVEDSGISIAGIAELPRDIDPHRDRYC